MLISPVIFKSVNGHAQKNPSGSKFNQKESEFVLHLIHELLKNDNIFGKTITAADIGVFTPYTAQAEKISRCLQSPQYNGIMVGTGPIFQGKEKLAMIVSMVASGNMSKFAADPRVSEF